jgi:hypothetical protein
MPAVHGFTGVADDPASRHRGLQIRYHPQQGKRGRLCWNPDTTGLNATKPDGPPFWEPAEFVGMRMERSHWDLRVDTLVECFYWRLIGKRDEVRQITGLASNRWAIGPRLVPENVTGKAPVPPAPSS